MTEYIAIVITTAPKQTAADATAPTAMPVITHLESIPIATNAPTVTERHIPTPPTAIQPCTHVMIRPATPMPISSRTVISQKSPRSARNQSIPAIRSIQRWRTPTISIHTPISGTCQPISLLRQTSIPGLTTPRTRLTIPTSQQPTMTAGTGLMAYM
ncbi:MAG: hypothetical protein KBONHNOK_00960 [Candidatus Methanoperedenaceae archaeon GB50]|nr:MAG: hypothetical protein KBONHNOK_00960 [Candidatus Methanoperedenaceae archaeon GB50]